MAPTAAAVVDTPVPVVVTKAVFDYINDHLVEVGVEGCLRHPEGDRYLRVGPATLDIRRALFDFAVRQLQPGEVLRRRCATSSCLTPRHSTPESRAQWGRSLGIGSDWRPARSA